MTGVLCPVWQLCGGCPTIQVPTERERARKLEFVRDLARGLVSRNVCSFHPAPSPTGYRNRIRLRVGEDGLPCFFNEQKALDCAVLEPLLRMRLEELRCACERDPGLLRGAQHVELRTVDRDGFSGLAVTWQTEQPEDLLGDWEPRLRDALPFALVVASAVLEGGRTPRVVARGAGSEGASAEQVQRFDLALDVYQCVPLFGFMQVNSIVNRALVAEVVSGAHRCGASTAVDLYCGSGNFALALSRAGLEVTGVELNAEGVLGAEQASREQGLSGRYVRGDVADFLALEDRRKGAPDLAVVDPPRAGLKGAVGDLVRLAPSAIALCSCRPKSLVRDLSSLVEHGYQVESLMLFDMFSFTDHVEVLAWLRR